MRKPTQDEELQAWRSLAWRINLHRTVTMNQDEVLDCLKCIDIWVQAHADGNGERSEADVTKNVTSAFWVHIAGKQPEPLPEKRASGRSKKLQ